MPEYRTRWFKRGDMEMWLEHLSYLRERPARYLEIGVFEGRSMVWVLDHLLVHPASIAVGVDPWSYIAETTGVTPAEIEGTARANLRPYGRKAVLIRSESVVYLAAAVASSIACCDLIYIDGSHRLVDIWVDLGLAWQCLEPGGVLVSDDYKGAEPTSMIDRFVELMDAAVVWTTRRQIAFRRNTQ